MSYGNFLEKALLDLAFGGATFTPSGTLYVFLSSGNPGESGHAALEPSTSYGYARVAVTNDKTNWSTVITNSGSLHNMTTITFPTAVSGNWGYVDYWGIFDQATGGNYYGYGSLTQPKTITIGDTLSFPSGSLVITQD